MKTAILIISLLIAPPLFAGTAPEVVALRLIDLIKQKNKPEAIALFYAPKPEQVEFVATFIDQGIEFMARVPIEAKVLAIFKDEEFAIVALEQSSPSRPGIREIEPIYLLNKDGAWLLLPKPDDWTRPINGLDTNSETHIRALVEKYNLFYNEQK